SSGSSSARTTKDSTTPGPVIVIAVGVGGADGAAAAALGVRIPMSSAPTMTSRRATLTAMLDLLAPSRPCRSGVVGRWPFQIVDKHVGADSAGARFDCTRPNYRDGSGMRSPLASTVISGCIVAGHR